MTEINGIRANFHSSHRKKFGNTYMIAFIFPPNSINTQTSEVEKLVRVDKISSSSTFLSIGEQIEEQKLSIDDLPDKWFIFTAVVDFNPTSGVYISKIMLVDVVKE